MIEKLVTEPYEHVLRDMVRDSLCTDLLPYVKLSIGKWYRSPLDHIGYTIRGLKGHSGSRTSLAVDGRSDVWRYVSVSCTS